MGPGLDYSWLKTSRMPKLHPVCFTNGFYQYRNLCRLWRCPRNKPWKSTIFERTWQKYRIDTLEQMYPIDRTRVCTMCRVPFQFAHSILRFLKIIRSFCTFISHYSFPQHTLILLKLTNFWTLSFFFKKFLLKVISNLCSLIFYDKMLDW